MKIENIYFIIMSLVYIEHNTYSVNARNNYSLYTADPAAYPILDYAWHGNDFNYNRF